MIETSSGGLSVVTSGCLLAVLGSQRELVFLRLNNKYPMANDDALLSEFGRKSPINLYLCAERTSTKIQFFAQNRQST